jgi:hypothetical protein
VISFLTVLMALSSCCRSTLLTISNEGIAKNLRSKYNLYRQINKSIDLETGGMRGGNIQQPMSTIILKGTA